MASRKIAVDLDLQKNAILNIVLQVLASAPSSPVEGQMYYDSTLDRPRWWDGTQWVNLSDRSFHTGTQLAATISDFDTQVRTSRLDQMAAPTADVSMNSQKLTNLGAPSAANDAARLVDVQGVSAGLAWKDSVRAATTAAGTLASSFENGDTIDGVTLATGDRILIKNQAAPAENGIYTVNASGAPTRATDADSAADILQATVFVEEGTTNADTAWVMSTNAPITLGTTGLTFVQFGAGSSVTAGAGLTLTGNTLDVGEGAGIDVQADAIAIDTAVVARKYSEDIGDGSSTAIVVTHNLGTRAVAVSVFRATTPWDEVDVVVEKTSTNTITLRFNVAPTTDEFTVAVIG